jgi:hypothetical protein
MKVQEVRLPVSPDLKYVSLTEEMHRIVKSEAALRKIKIGEMLGLIVSEWALANTNKE